MCTNPRNVRNILRENSRTRDRADRGDGATTLLQDLSMQIISRESFLNRVTIASIIFLICLLLSKQLVWASIVFECLKPLYFVYVCVVVVVDFVGPFVHWAEDWYHALIEYFSDTTELQGESLHSRERSSINEDEYDSIMQDVNRLREDANLNVILDNCDFHSCSQNSGQSRNAGNDHSQQNEDNQDHNRTSSNHAGREVRQIKFRRRVGDSQSRILKAIESELRKEAALKGQ